MKENVVDDKELKLIQRGMDYRSVKLLESNEQRLEMIIGYLERGVTVEERINKSRAVTPEMIRDAAQESLPNRYDDTYVILIKDPLKEKDS